MVYVPNGDWVRGAYVHMYQEKHFVGNEQLNYMTDLQSYIWLVAPGV